MQKVQYWQKDFFYQEDKHVLGRESWGEVWTVLTNIALSLAQLLRRRERTLKEVREQCHANPTKTAKKTRTRRKLVSGLSGLGVERGYLLLLRE